MYCLLPFRFHRLPDCELIVNEVGDFLTLQQGSIEAIINRKIDPESDLYKDLKSGYFISEKPVPELIDNYAVRLRTKKAFLNYYTALHIFVLTLRCNQNCVYCQASSRKEHCGNSDMSRKTIDKSVELMFRSPSPHLTMEFQGGESSLVPHLVEYAILKAEEKNETAQRQITYVLCTNCVELTDRILNICEKYRIVISTSLDGFEELHNLNRGKSDSYSKTVNGIAKARNRLGEQFVSALMTTSELSLDYPKEIVDAYRENGFHSIFIRALNPYGLASSNQDWQQYCDRFVEFYKIVLDYILELNRNGIFFVEEFTAIILRKILTPFNTGFVDLQSPAGLVNGVVVYNYDGYVYASDESRMLAENGDYSFRLGSVDDPYEKLFYGDKVKEIAECWTTESIAGCSDCAFQSFCGADPVRNYTTQNDMYGNQPTSLFCRKHRKIIEHIFSLLIHRKEEVMPVFRSEVLRYMIDHN